ncbi:hypothetical protein D3C75_1265730 [compost metagenome]
MRPPKKTITKKAQLNYHMVKIMRILKQGNISDGLQLQMQEVPLLKTLNLKFDIQYHPQVLQLVVHL